MSEETVRNMAHSINARLKNIARKNKISFEYILLRYALERFLYRLGISSHSERFVLKGATLFSIWLGPMYRVTRDADFYCAGESAPEFLVQCFREICDIDILNPDGVTFDAGSIKTGEIKKEQQYNGTRLTLRAHIAQARVMLQFDIGFGDSIFPGADFNEYPVILDSEPPKIKVYSRYTVIAEKFEAMVFLGIKNSRLKDFYDIWLLSQQFDFDLVTLNTAIIKTFERRKTMIPPARPLALTDEFISDPIKLSQWNAFLRKTSPKNAPADLNVIVSRIAEFLMPLIEKTLPADAKWQAAAGWTKAKT